MKRYIYIFPILLLFLIIAATTSCKKEKQQVINTDTDTFNEMRFFASIDQSKIQSINEIIEGFTSPIEMAAMIEDNKIPFSKKYLASTDIIDNYDTNIKKAFGLGVLSADLGYLTVYQKNNMIVNYLIAINRLANDLKVAQFFDFETLKNLVSNSDNIDSLVFISVSGFHQIDQYFRQSNRSYLSVLSVTGVWIESFYLITQVAKDNPELNFKDIIGSQKTLFTKLFEIIKVYKGHPTFDYIISQMNKLRIAFEPVQITEKHVQPKVEYKDGNLVIYPETETIITVSDDNLQNIIKTTQQVRNNLLNLQ